MYTVSYRFNGKLHTSKVTALSLNFVIESILDVHPELSESDIKIGWL